jgi:XTP/dITP diphosphohydrolase
MIELIFATSNRHKVEEIQAVIGDLFKITTMTDAGINIDIPEPHDSLEMNASEKSNTIYRLTGKASFGEDTGLEVKALNGEPGVRSARYAGEDKAFDKNIQLLLKNLGDVADRKARFRTVISLIFNQEEHLFEGICEGVIEKAPRGSNGFGYDPVFKPEGSNKTFAEMSMAEKGMYSHRKKATDKLVLFLQQAESIRNKGHIKTK